MTQTAAQLLAAATEAGPEETIRILREAGVIQDKPWWQSAGINGSVVGAVSSTVMIATALSQLFGWTISTEAVAYLTMGLIGLGSAITTWWARVRASQPISRAQVLPNVTLERSP